MIFFGVLFGKRKPSPVKAATAELEQYARTLRVLVERAQREADRREREAGRGR